MKREGGINQDAAEEAHPGDESVAGNGRGAKPVKRASAAKRPAAKTAKAARR